MARKRAWSCDFKANLVGHSRLLRPLARHGNRRLMVINSHEPGIRKCLCHEDGGRPMAANDVGYAAAFRQLLLDTLESWNPGLSQMRPVSIAEESLGSGEQAAIVFVPAHSFARAESGKELVFTVPQRSRHIECRWQECGTFRIRQDECVFCRQLILIRVLVESHVAPGNLCVEPFPHGAFIGGGAACELV